jgi:hypothetical protein
MPYSRGWQALIYAPGSNRYLPESPSTRDPAGRTSLRDTAKLIVDHHEQVRLRAYLTLILSNYPKTSHCPASGGAFCFPVPFLRKRLVRDFVHPGDT